MYVFWNTLVYMVMCGCCCLCIYMMSFRSRSMRQQARMAQEQQYLLNNGGQNNGYQEPYRNPWQGQPAAIGVGSAPAPPPIQQNQQIPDDLGARPFLDESLPKTQVKLFLVNNQTALLKLNTTHTVGDIRNFIDSVQNPPITYELKSLASHPPVTLLDAS